ncbi:hypothetical protein ABL325_003284 [Escherichia coli]|uniref:hypothetical protein n=1 Tax=Escherichia TaxID=561 RepID=UPI00141990DB|nr:MULTISPECIES: hypothetical protein [Escherichia]EFW7444375.1 hypothetical protein [Shigella sonnei]KAF3715725.1 hypothetical protein FM737_002548 [Escherichia marmotae]MBY7334187.1 hypothetical protein [Escherichia coli]MBY7475366.1 hypothetical protein [Escherichia coli]MDN2007572.1 hypothetical protein [Escherichia coli]
MAQGLQCWDASGRLVVDLGDYNMRYMGTASLSIAAGNTTTWSVAFNGMRPTGWLAIARNSQYWTNFYCIPGTNSFSVRHIPTGYVMAQTLTFDIYAFE